MTRHKKNRFKIKSVYLWHRYLGLSAAAFVMLLSVTGIMLNHTNELSLSKKQITSEWILNWYGIEVPALVATYQSGEFFVTQWNSEIYLNQFHLGQYDSMLIGMAKQDDLIVIALTGKILLTTTEGEIIEVLDHTKGLPSGIKNIGTSADGTLIVDAAHGYYQTDNDFLNWQHTENKTSSWAEQTKLDPDLQENILTGIRHHSIHYERLTLDLHSGRFFGSWGIYIMDAAAIILLLLSISGGSLWLIRIIKQKQHRNKH